MIPHNTCWRRTGTIEIHTVITERRCANTNVPCSRRKGPSDASRSPSWRHWTASLTMTTHSEPAIIMEAKGNVEFSHGYRRYCDSMRYKREFVMKRVRTLEDDRSAGVHFHICYQDDSLLTCTSYTDIRFGAIILRKSFGKHTQTQCRYHANRIHVTSVTRGWKECF